MNFEYNIQPRWETDGRWDEGEEYSDGNGIWDEGEEYIDGNNVYDVGEDYEDSNNGKWDPWEKYVDGNDVYDEGESFTDSYNGNWDPWEVYVDSHNGKWDPWEEYVDGNGIWDEGEEYVDCGLDNRGAPICEYDVAWENTFGDGKWNVGEDFTDSNNGNWDPWEEYVDGNGIWDEGEEYIDGNNVYDVGENYFDSNNGNWDPWEEYVDGNGMWDEGEEYVDSNNGKWDTWEKYFDSNNGNWDPWEEYVDGIEVYDRKLEWQVTEEPQDASSKYFIYRVPKENVADLLTPESCDSCLITTLTSFSVASYTDSDSLILTEFEEQTFYYLVQVSTKNGYTRNSFIHYNGFPQPEGTSLNYVSQNKDEYIEIKWTSITESDYFYQYEILRTLGSPEQGNDTLIVAIIPNIEIDHFMDRSEELLGGTTYYYSIAVVDINGRKQHSDFIRGYSNP
jgi:hypothetical protein